MTYSSSAGHLGQTAGGLLASPSDDNLLGSTHAVWLNVEGRLLRPDYLRGKLGRKR